MFTELFVIFCALSFAQPRFLGGDDPMIDMLKEVVYEANVYLIQHKLDVVDIPQQTRSGWLYSMEIKGGKVGNFSSAIVVGEPKMNETTIPTDIDGYFFDMGLSLTDMHIQAEYRAKLLGILSYSGVLEVVNTGNAIQVQGVVKSYKDGKCNVEIMDIQLKKMGKVELSIKPSGISHWLMEKIAGVMVRVAAPFSYGTVTKVIKQVAATDKVKQIVNEIMCRYF